MLGKFFNKKKERARRLEHPRDLRVGDILELKPRSILPEELQGASLTVKSVCAYEYSDGLVTEFALIAESAKQYSMSFESGDDGDELCFSHKLSHQQVLQCFDEDSFGGLWSDEHVSFDSRQPEGALGDWIAKGYRQTVKEATAYFYDKDKRGSAVSEYLDKDAQELRYHECEGEPDQFSLNVEIWEDGETDVFALVSVPLNVIEEMWPNGD
ncbi:MAG: hypothetical protein COA42_00185 [Alteromonadaceae bacterium]|nr:MAG: hypothetical protein COA42_00185 [Alteromonadaceae bacterium]